MTSILSHYSCSAAGGGGCGSRKGRRGGKRGETWEELRARKERKYSQVHAHIRTSRRIPLLCLTSSLCSHSPVWSLPRCLCPRISVFSSAKWLPWSLATTVRFEQAVFLSSCQCVGLICQIKTPPTSSLFPHSQV